MIFSVIILTLSIAVFSIVKLINFKKNLIFILFFYLVVQFFPNLIVLFLIPFLIYFSWKNWGDFKLNYSGIEWFLIFFLSLNISLPQTLNDYHGYYLQTVKWNREYGTVLGLGNLHGRLAFNSFFLTLSSIFYFDSETIFKNSRHFLIFPLNAVFLFIYVKKAMNLIKNEKVFFIKIFFSLNILFSVVLYSKWIGTPSNDIAAGLLISYIIIFFYEWNKSEKDDLIKLLITLIYFAIIVKLSSIFSVLFLIPIFLKLNDKIHFIKTSILFGSVIIIPFLIKNILLSGYLIYPFAEIDWFNLQWKIPLDKVIAERNTVYSWARLPGTSVNSLKHEGILYWLLPWFYRNDFLTKILLLSNLFFPFIVLFSKSLRQNFFIGSITLITLGNLLFWFFQAPDPRFAFGFLFVGASISFAWSISHVSNLCLKALKWITEPKRFINIGVICIFIFYGFYLFPKIKKTQYLLDVLIFPAQIERFNLNKITDNNFSYYIPTNNGSCGYAELPCANEEIKGLKLRGQDLKSGFYIY